MGCSSAGFHGLLSPYTTCVRDVFPVEAGFRQGCSYLCGQTLSGQPGWWGAHVKFNHVLSILRYLPLHTQKKSQIPSLGVYLHDVSEGIY